MLTHILVRRQPFKRHIRGNRIGSIRENILNIQILVIGVHLTFAVINRSSVRRVVIRRAAFDEAVGDTTENWTGNIIGKL